MGLFDEMNQVRRAELAQCNERLCSRFNGGILLVFNQSGQISLSALRMLNGTKDRLADLLRHCWCKHSCFGS